MSTAPVSPYKGLSAFDDSELDALFFFGRERETEIVVANLIASRLTVLYGPSGVGKSSLLRAAVARSLRQLPEEPLVVVFSQWSTDPAVALAEVVAGAAGVDGGPMDSVIDAAQDGRDVYVILDQAEEYFLYHADDAGPASFMELLPSVLATPRRVNVLVSLREDSLAKLDRFTGRISGLFANTLRLDRLDRAAGRAAISKPVERFAELTGQDVVVEADLVERVLDEVGAGQIEPAIGGLGAVEDDEVPMWIEAPYLQLVMQRLWDEERATGSSTLRVSTLERLGGAQHIVEEHLEGAMAELSEDGKDIASRLFNHLVTPSGTKIAHEVADLADFGRVAPEEVTPVLDALAERRILRPLDEGGARRYEIFHDVLAQPVLAWRARYRTEREVERQLAESHRRRRRLQWLVAGALVALALMTAVSAFALDQRSEAQEQAREARASGLVAAADVELDRDPELSLLLAGEAARISSDESVQRSLREALDRSRLRRQVELESPIVAAARIGDDLVAVTESGEVVRASPDGTTTRQVVGGPAAHASFADDGSVLVTGRSGAVYEVKPGGAPTQLAGSARAAEISRDGTVAAVIGGGEVRLVSTRTGETLQTYPHPGARAAAISPDNRRVLTGGADDMVRVWSGQSGRRVHTLTEHTGNVAALAYSPDGEHVASASTNGTARIWRTKDWGLSSSLAGHTNALTDVSFSEDGEHLVTAGRDGSARVSAVADGDELFVLSGHRDGVETAAFVGGVGSDVVTGGQDGTIRVWYGVYQPELEELARLPAPITSITVGDDGIRARTAAGREHLLSVDGTELGVETVPKLRPRRVVGPDGTSATFRGRAVRLLREGEVTMLRGHGDDVTSVAFSPSGELLLTTSLDRTARVWDVATAEPLRTYLHNTSVRDAQFSPDGRWVITAPLRASLFAADDTVNILRLRGHEGRVTASAFLGDSETIVTGGVDGTVRVYRCELCGDLDELSAIADARLRATGRGLTPGERARYLD